MVHAHTHHFMKSIYSRSMSDQARENYDKIDWSDGTLDNKREELLHDTSILKDNHP